MEIKEELTSWYRIHHRKLIFRESRDPYAIWVSEIMAQQTRIDTMLAYYERWVKDYPTIQALAAAPIEKVLKSWEGLGYYNRARKLHEGAQLVCEKYNGQLPRDIEALQKIPGIGSYTAGAIASIAFELRAPAVDGNVLRVISRLFLLEDDIASQKTHKKVYDMVYELMGASNPSDFTQGLMELGALICTPQNWKCDQCPLNAKCQAYKAGRQSELPMKKAKKAPDEIELITVVIAKEQGVVLCEDWQDGLMKGFLRLPQYKQTEISTDGLRYLMRKKHVFSHRIWHMNVYLDENAQLPMKTKEQLIAWDELDQVSIVTAHRKILEQVRRKYL